MFNPKTTDGKRFSLGGQDWFVPPLVIDQLRLVVPAVNRATQAMANGRIMSTEALDDVGMALFVALCRNYPDLKREHFDVLPAEMGDLMEGLAAVSEAAGLTRKATPAIAAVDLVTWRLRFRKVEGLFSDEDWAKVDAVVDHAIAVIDAARPKKADAVGEAGAGERKTGTS